MSTTLSSNGFHWSNGSQLTSSSDGSLGVYNSGSGGGSIAAISFTLIDGQGSLYSNGSNMVLTTDDNLYINAPSSISFSSSLSTFSGAMLISGNNTGWNGAAIGSYFVSSDNSRYGYLANSGGTGHIDTNNVPPNGGSSNATYGLFVTHRIGCGDELDVFCDERIKQDINDINTADALEKLRLINPKTYSYIDKPKNKLNYGFIAQEINKVFSDSVSKICNFIPNIYDLGELIDKNRIILKNKLTKDFIINDLNKDFKIKIIINNKDVIVTLKMIIDDKTFIINEDLEKIKDNDKNYIIVYGQEVNDFHLLEKNAIFTLTTSAVKQLDKELTETKKIIQDQQKQIDLLQEQLNKINELIK